MGVIHTHSIHTKLCKAWVIGSRLNNADGESNAMMKSLEKPFQVQRLFDQPWHSNRQYLMETVCFDGTTL